MYQSFFTWLSDTVNSILTTVLNVLPDSPFVILSANETITRYLSYINWIIPLDFMVATTEAWLTAVLIYYVWSLVLRWAKAID